MKVAVLAVACGLIVLAAEVDAARLLVLALLGGIDVVVVGWALGGRR